MTTIAHGVTLNRYPALTVPIDSMGTVEFWNVPIHQIYAQMPYKALFNGLDKNIWDEKNNTLEQVKAQQKEPCLLDYDINTPGNQRAVGLHWSNQNRIDLLVAANWSLIKARAVFSHEFGHRYQHMCRLLLMGTETSSARRALRTLWDTLRPHQGHNTWEDWAEVCRAVFGSDEARGTFSDGKPANISGKLRSLIRGAFWFSFIKEDVTDVQLGDFYIQWKHWTSWVTYEYRYFNTENFTQYIWQNGQWQQKL